MCPLNISFHQEGIRHRTIMRRLGCEALRTCKALWFGLVWFDFDWFDFDLAPRGCVWGLGVGREVGSDDKTSVKVASVDEGRPLIDGFAGSLVRTELFGSVRDEVRGRKGGE